MPVVTPQGLCIVCFTRRKSLIGKVLANRLPANSHPVFINQDATRLRTILTAESGEVFFCQMHGFLLTWNSRTDHLVHSGTLRIDCEAAPAQAAGSGTRDR